MKTELKVGDSFEVVRPLSEYGYSDAFDVNRTTLLNPYNGDVICNTDFYRRHFRGENTFFHNQNALCLPNNLIKRIGKLTITKVK